MSEASSKSLAHGWGIPWTTWVVPLCAVALGVAILAGGSNAVLATVGLVAFALFVREPAWGVYCTTVLLLLQYGEAGIIGSLGAAVPVTGAKLCGLATFVAWLAVLLMRRDRFIVDRKLVFLVAFLLWALLSVLLSDSVDTQFPEWVRAVSSVAFFVTAVHVLNTRAKWRRLVQIIVVCGFLMSVVAVAQYLLPSLQFGGASGIERMGAGAAGAFVDVEGVQSGAAVRASGTRGHSNWLAMALLMILPLNAYWMACAQTRRSKVFGGVMLVFEILALVLTFTRVGFVVGIALVGALAFRGLLRINAYRVAWVAAALLIVWFFLPIQYKERVFSFGQYTTSESTESRLEVQSYAWQYLSENPILGVGLGGFGLRLLQERSGEIPAMFQWMVKNQGWNPTSMGAHNMYLQVACEAGLIGLFLLLLFLYAALLDLRRAQRTFAASGDREAATLADALWVSLVTFLLCALFLHALQEKTWWIVVAAAGAAPLLARHADKGERLPGEAIPAGPSTRATRAWRAH